MNRSLMLLGLLVGSVIGLGEAIAETARRAGLNRSATIGLGWCKLLHVFFFAGPLALALGNWRLRASLSSPIARFS